MNENKFEEFEKEFLLLCKRIDIINKELVILLNSIETEFSVDPFSKEENNEAYELWHRVSNVRNYKIY